MASFGPDELPYLVAAVAILLSIVMMLQPKKSSGGASETVRVLLSCIRRAINSSMYHVPSLAISDPAVSPWPTSDLSS